MEKATLGGGCFWCIDTVFRRLKGVDQVISGYMGGKNPNPTYKEVCSGLTGHAEVVEITFDPKIIDFSTLLEVFWTVHDPTSLNRQGNDVGTQYRSVIFYHNDEQKRKALQSIQDIASTLYENPVVTQVASASTFYPAENYHQNYYNRNGYAPYCRIIISPKVAKLRQKFAHLLEEAPSNS